ncbi:SapC family protein [Halomonas vilamensis]|uniref:SapC family protein n=1 Tax=Vreelandella vilamensis TaxID=531309 RepID=A0ABU1H840_9GAMM|nr:SapC family protein [Halomonas vilamensis]MDR5900466.1 SapC family protein [Halomonas vilamensis]
MSEWIVLSSTQHARKRALPRVGFQFAAQDSVVPIMAVELGRLLSHYVIAFLKQEAGFQPVALLSHDAQRNLYVAPDGRWLGKYVPAALRSYPFAMASSPDGQQQLAIHSSHLSDEEGSALFTEAGEPSEWVNKTMVFLKHCEQHRRITQEAMSALDKAGIIEPWPLTIERAEQTPLNVQGLYRINGQALNTLDADTLHSLRGASLALAHAQMFSTHQLYQLTERAELLAKYTDSGNAPDNLDEVFGGEDDDLEFDFS